MTSGIKPTGRRLTYEAAHPLADFRRATLGLTVAVSGGIGFLWHLTTFALHPEQIAGYYGLSWLLVVATSALSLALLEQRPRTSAAVWVAGTSALIATSILAYGQPMLGLGYSLVVLAVTVLYGWPAGALAEALAAGALLLLGRLLPAMPALGQGALPAICASCGAFGIGGILHRTFAQSIREYHARYLQANEGIEEARRQRVELKEVQEDLVLANHELSRLTKRLEVLSQVAEEARRAKETFVATVSHELRTPLNMIIGFSEVMSQSPQTYGVTLPPTLMADISSIQRNSQHLLELVNDVLDLSQVDMGNLSVSREWSSLQRIAGEALEVIRPLFVSKGLELRAELPEQDQSVYCDSTRIREVIINLLSNAGRFTEKGGVCLKASADEGALVIAVQDTGPGIAPGNQARLFEPFQQLDSSIRRQYGGSGLGLAISKRFVEMHGGDMWLESEVGVGTTVYFSLPLQAPQPTSEGMQGLARWFGPYVAYEPRTRAFRASLGAARPRCLVLEKGNIVGKLFGRYLGEMEVVPVGDIDQAAAELARSPAQLLALNHPQACELLQALSARGGLPLAMPVVAFWLPGGEDYAGYLGVMKYLVKPVSKDMLLGALEELGDGVRQVLLVDDNPEVLQLFGRILSFAGRRYSTLRASSSEQALEMLRERHPDLMILDLIMPEMTGFEVLEAKANDPAIRDIPVFVVTAQDPAGVPRMSAAVTLAKEGGFSPRDLVELARSVSRQLEPAGPPS